MMAEPSIQTNRLMTQLDRLFRENMTLLSRSLDIHRQMLEGLRTLPAQKEERSIVTETEVPGMEIRSDDHPFPVTSKAMKFVEKDFDRWAWDLSNISSVTVNYRRGKKGASVTTSGSNQGISIASNAADGMDRFDAVDEAWVIAGSSIDVIVSETFVTGWTKLLIP